VAGTAFLRVRAWAALGAFAGSLLLPSISAGHSATDGDDAGDPALAARHVTEQVEPVRSPVTGDHCPLCHWLRAVGGARPAVGGLPRRVLQPTAAPALEITSVVPAAPVGRQRSRAPPPPGIP
jgi:hypothetical protein